MKFACWGCGEVYHNKNMAEMCCDEGTHEVTDCCEAKVVESTLRDFPFGGSIWHIDYDIEKCGKCGVILN